MSASRRRTGGFTYLGVLFLVAMVGIGLGATGMWWRATVLREKEAQLLFVGEEFRRALISYRDSLAGAREYPRRLEDLLEDRRVPGVKRHLRRIYDDPMTGRPDWRLVQVDDRIVGVASRSTGVPYRKSGFPPSLADFARAKQYSDWVFGGDSAAGQAAGLAQAGVDGGPPPFPASMPAAPVPAVQVPADPPEPPPPQPERNACEARYASALARCTGLRNPSRELTACKDAAYQDFRSCRLGR